MKRWEISVSDDENSGMSTPYWFPWAINVFFCPSGSAGRNSKRGPRADNAPEIIYAVVEVSTREEAAARGSTTFDQLVGVHPEEAAVFDYYVTFDDDRSSVVGKARWGELPVVALVDSQTGAALLERGWKATIHEFERKIVVEPC